MADKQKSEARNNDEEPSLLAHILVNGAALGIIGAFGGFIDYIVKRSSYRNLRERPRRMRSPPSIVEIE